MSTTAEEIIKASASVARDAAEGRLTPSTLDGAVMDECRSLFGTVAGPDDALWELQREVARQVLGLDGIPVTELAEWLAVARQRAGAASEAVDLSVSTGAADSSASGPHSPDSEFTDDETGIDSDT